MESGAYCLSKLSKALALLFLCSCELNWESLHTSLPLQGLGPWLFTSLVCWVIGSLNNTWILSRVSEYESTGGHPKVHAWIYLDFHLIVWYESTIWMYWSGQRTAIPDDGKCFHDCCALCVTNTDQTTSQHLLSATSKKNPKIVKLNDSNTCHF